jgi:two-component system cell cycle response regulator
MAEAGTSPSCVRDACILVASDDEAIGGRAVSDLLAAGYRVIGGATVASAIGSVRQQRPDLVILEVNSSAGLVALWALQSGTDTCRTPIVTVARNPTPDWAAECLRLGAADHLRSPFDPIELLARVDAAVKGAARLDQLERRTEILEYLGTFDELTWLANRRHLEDELVRATASSGRHHHPMSLVVTAADNWDVVAQLADDAERTVLREIAVLIGSIRRTEDIAARWDDSSFAVLLPMVGAEGAHAFAERLLSVVAIAPIPVGAGSLAVTMSAGFVAYPDGEGDSNRLVASAEAALMLAQACGGNQVMSI